MKQGTLVRTSLLAAVFGAVALFYAIGFRRSPSPVLVPSSQQAPAPAR